MSVNRWIRYQALYTNPLECILPSTIEFKHTDKINSTEPSPTTGYNKRKALDIDPLEQLLVTRHPGAGYRVLASLSFRVRQFKMVCSSDIP